MLENQNQATTSTFKRVIEIYLFVNPIGSRCYESEKEVLAFVEHLDQKVHFRFIPFYNFQTVSNFMKFNQLPEKNLELRNEICNHTYLACLAYKAALMQGKKKGRAFLLTLQKELVENKATFSESLLIEVAKSAKLDIPMFIEDKASDFAKSSYEEDQRIAHEMSIKSNPSMVIFDNENEKYGLLVESCITVDLLKKLCNTKGSLKENHKNLVSQTNRPIINQRHLRIL